MYADFRFSLRGPDFSYRNQCQSIQFRSMLEKSVFWSSFFALAMSTPRRMATRQLRDSDRIGKIHPSTRRKCRPSNNMTRHCLLPFLSSSCRTLAFIPFIMDSPLTFSSPCLRSSIHSTANERTGNRSLCFSPRPNNNALTFNNAKPPFILTSTKHSHCLSLDPPYFL